MVDKLGGRVGEEQGEQGEGGPRQGEDGMVKGVALGWEWEDGRVSDSWRGKG